MVEEALRRGHTVIAFVHHHDLFSPSGKLIVMKGDIYDAKQVRDALKGSNAVVSCLGSWGTPTKGVLSAAMRQVTPAMRELNLQRIVTLTGSGALAPGQNVSLFHKLMLKLPIFGAGKVFADGEEHMRLLAESDLEWTTLRSPVMNNIGRTTYLLNMKAGSPLATIKRQAVASAMLDQLETDGFSRQAPIIHRK